MRWPILLFFSPQIISGNILGQSPVAQGFLQSFNPAQITSYSSYSTPLGPLSFSSTTTVSVKVMGVEGLGFSL